MKKLIIIALVAMFGCQYPNEINEHISQGVDKYSKVYGRDPKHHEKDPRFIFANGYTSFWDHYVPGEYASYSLLNRMPLGTLNRLLIRTPQGHFITYYAYECRPLGDEMVLYIYHYSNLKRLMIALKECGDNSVVSFRKRLIGCSTLRLKSRNIRLLNKKESLEVIKNNKGDLKVASDNKYKNNF